ncbi:helix-turn-helix domain-containing protein [Pokkaliibacter sp. CJK22405]|uniref:helix-turn-helix domain-containing protein n=1 Tax=Pokkaliibacter sp. CJK22405 TaxID=3384615 RepID=UPI0039849081
MSSKQQLAFYRRLYLALCISQQQHNLGSLMALTNMPRRTLQDSIKAMADIGIVCHFVQRNGTRNNDGYFEITDWGPIRQDWVVANRGHLIEQLELPDYD